MPSGTVSSVSPSPYVAHSGTVTGNCVPSAFGGQPVGIDKVGEIWIGDSESTSHMTRSADLIYDTRYNLFSPIQNHPG